MLNIVLFGAPGCGKGTQASRLREHYGINHVSTGEVIRAEIARGTELGRSMEEYIKTGRLAPDAVVIGMIANYVAEHRDAAAGIAHRAEHTEVVGAYYARQNKYFEVDGVGSMDEVFDRICRVVDAHR